MGDPRLLRTAQRVPETLFGSAELNALIEDMFDTMHANAGAGLAAPQIGVDWQLFVFGFEHNARYPDAPVVPKTVLINPTITPQGNNQESDWEGCLSIPGLRGKVPRWTQIRYEGLDANGVSVNREAEDFHARVVQHEYDHLLGILYPMRIKDFSQFGFSEVLFPEPPDSH